MKKWIHSASLRGGGERRGCASNMVKYRVNDFVDSILVSILDELEIN